MKRHPIIAFVLAMMLVLTSQAMAVARGTPSATGQMVLCIGGEVVTVYTDAQGQPTAAPHICPDCALSLAFQQVTPELNRIVTPRGADLSQQVAALFTPSMKGFVPQTRAPPLAV